MKKSNTSQNMREFRRLRAIELYNQGQKPIHIAKNLGVTRGAVSQWLKKYREQGEEALYYQRIARRHCKLSDEQIEQLKKMLHEGADKFGYSENVWTSSRVRDLIEAKFYIKYSCRNVRALLKKWGWTPQKPATRANQRDDEAVKHWREERWPAIKKSSN